MGPRGDSLTRWRCAPQAAYASNVLNESQFSELESLQTPDSMNFVAEGAARPKSAVAQSGKGLRPDARSTPRSCGELR
jgi:hypothetical protein